MKSSTISGVLDLVGKNTDGKTAVSFADIVKSLNHRGFGALLILPTVIVILPTGAIPGVPALCALFICLVAGQMLLGRDNPWIPKTLRNFSIGRKKIMSAIEKVKPYAKVVDRYTCPRFTVFTHDIFQRLIALLCVALALIMFIVGFIPFLPALLAVPILFFAMGLTARDGLMTFVGLVFSAGAIFIIGGLFLNGDRAIEIDYPVFGHLPSFYMQLDVLP